MGLTPLDPDTRTEDNILSKGFVYVEGRILLDSNYIYRERTEYNKVRKQNPINTVRYQEM